MFVRSFKISIILGSIVVFLTIFIVHLQAQYIVQAKPMNLASAVAQWVTSEYLVLYTLASNINTDKNVYTLSLVLLYLFIFFAYDEFRGSLESLNQIKERYEKEYGPGNYIPFVKTLFWSFRAMVGAGSVMILLGLYGVYKIR